MRGRSIVFFFLLCIVIAGATGFFLGANYVRRGHSQSISQVTTAATDTVADAVTVATEDVSEVTTETAPADAQKYTVKKGDTLFSIGKQFNVEWPVLAKANTLEETSILKEGQVLQIPTASEAKTIQAHEISVKPDQEESQNLAAAQEYARAGTGQLAYRLDPVQVVQQSRLLSRFLFNQSDLYIEKSRDTEKGEAIVEVTHGGNLYTVYLTQPLDKGAKGVWSPSKVIY